MKKSKLRIAVDGIIIPFVVYFVVSVATASIFVLITNNMNPNLVLVQGISNIFMFALLFPLYVLFKKKYKIKSENIKLSACLYMIPIAFSVCIIGNVLVDFIPRTEENLVTMEVYKLAEEYNVYLSLFIVSVLIPIIEEIIFRGFFYDAIMLISNDIFAIILSSIAFAVAHVDLRQGLYALFAGLILAYIRYKYKNLIYTILLHLLMNFSSLVFVPSVLAIEDLRQRMMVVFISVAILFFSIMRISLRKDNA